MSQIFCSSLFPARDRTWQSLVWINAEKKSRRWGASTCQMCVCVTTKICLHAWYATTGAFYNSFIIQVCCCFARRHAIFYLGGKDATCLWAFNRQTYLTKGPCGALEGFIKALPACSFYCVQLRVFSRGRRHLKQANKAQKMWTYFRSALLVVKPEEEEGVC